MSVTVILNSRSGTAVPDEEIRAAYLRLGVDPRIIAIEEHGFESEVLSAAARSTQVLVAAGGDGTISATAQILARSGSDAALALMPLGTCNDLSRSLDIPADIDQSAEVAVRGRNAPMDLIAMDDGTFVVNQANGGFSGSVAQELDADTKARWGPWGYWGASIEALQQMEQYELRLVIDGVPLETTALNVTVANARFSGGGIATAPLADPADGLMDIVIVEARTRLQLLPLVPLVLRGQHLDAEGVLFRQARTLELESTPPMPFSIDGELADHHATRFHVEPGRIQVRVAR